MDTFCSSDDLSFLLSLLPDINPCYEIGIISLVPIIILYIYGILYIEKLLTRKIEIEYEIKKDILIIYLIIINIIIKFILQFIYNTSKPYIILNNMLTIIAWGIILIFLYIYQSPEVIIDSKRIESIIIIYLYQRNLYECWTFISYSIEIVCILLLIKYYHKNNIDYDHLYTNLSYSGSLNYNNEDNMSIWNRLLLFRSSIFDNNNSFNDLSVTSWMESIVGNRLIVQFSIKVKSVEAGTYKVWRTINDFELLHQKVLNINHSPDIPLLSITNNMTLVQKRDILDKYISSLTLINDPAITKLLTSFTDLEERINSNASVKKSKSSASMGNNIIFSESTHSSQVLLLDDNDMRSDETLRRNRQEKLDRDAEFRRAKAQILSVSPISTFFPQNSSMSYNYNNRMAKSVSFDDSIDKSASYTSTLTNTLHMSSLENSYANNKDRSYSKYNLNDFENEFEEDNQITKQYSLVSYMDLNAISLNDQIALRNMRGCINLSFIGFIRTRSVNSDRDVVFYSIAVRSKIGDWVIQHRFSQFVNLHDSMLATLNENTLLPEIPKSTLFGISENSVDFIDNRRCLLEIWMQKIVNTVCLQCPELFKFLSPVAGTPIISLNSNHHKNISFILPQPPLDENNAAMIVVETSQHTNVFIDPSWGTHFFDAEVLRWQIMESDTRNAYVVYTIIVKEFYSRTEFISWQISRRYREFETLRSTIEKMSNNVPLPPLPPKKLNGQDPKVINIRVKFLEAFLHELINTTYFQIDELFAFLDLHNPQRNIVTGVAFTGSEFSEHLIR